MNCTATVRRAMASANQFGDLATGRAREQLRAAARMTCPATDVPVDQHASML
jgi:hypothetical protein